MYDANQYHPFATTDLTGHTVLLLSPHPDDESLACGGSLALHTMRGDRVKIVFLTDGAKADTHAEFTREDYVLLRQAEARQAGVVLGVDDMEFWDVPDGALGQTDGVLSKLCTLLSEYQPTLVYSPSPLEFHPDHRAAANLVWRSIQRTMLNCKVAFYDYNRPININTLVDISSQVDTKRLACDCYQSQLKYYSYTECAISFNRYRALTVSPSCQYAEGFHVLDAPEVWGKPIETFTLKQFLPLQPNNAPPLVSVIVRTRNRLALLREALSSLLTQTYPNIEVVIVNDGGDEVTGLVDEFRRFIPVTHIHHKEPLGRAAAANSGVRAAQGKYINLLDDDDFLYTGHVEKLASFLETTGEHFAYSDCEQCDYQWTGEAWIPLGQKQTFKTVDFDRNKLDRGNYIASMCAMFRRDLFDLSGPFDESLEWLEDWDMWIRMACHAAFHRLPGVTAEYRQFGQNRYDNQLWTLKIYEKYGHRPGRDCIVHHTPQTGVLDKVYRLPELPEQSSQFTGLPAMRGYVEALTPLAGGRIFVHGWALLPETPLQVMEVYYGGQAVEAYPILERPDIGAHFSWIRHASMSGFEFTLDVGDVDRSGGAGLLELVGLADGQQTAVLTHLVRHDVDRFPSPPEDYMQLVVHNQNPHFFKVGALRAFGDFLMLLNRHLSWDNGLKVLDWGCGSGRLSAQFLAASPSLELTGADLDPAAIDWCRSNLVEGRFDTLSPMPPTQYAGGEFDLILSFSVLTHLGRDTQESWLREMHRVLKSGGWFLTTTHGEFTYKFARENLEPEWPEDEFYDCPDSTLAGISPPGYYRGSYQSERYTRREFGKLFEIVEYVPRGACGFQDLVLLRKP